MGAVTGSSLAAAAMMTKVAFPEMLRHKYDPKVAAGVIAGASPLVLIIPPSIFLLFYAVMTYEDAGKVLLAGFIPGVLAAVIYLVIIYVMAWRSPEKWPPMTRSFTWGERIRATRGIGPVVLMVILTLGGIYGGIFTPSEGGAAGAFIALIFLLVMKRSQSWRLVVHSVWEAASTTSMVFFIVIGALLYGWFFSFTGAGEQMINALANIPVSPYVILAAIMVIYLMLGCFIDGISLFAITLPVAHPLIIKLGFDPIWFGVVAVILVGVGALTPPFGIVVFTVKSLVGKQVDLIPIFVNSLPYALAMLVLIVLMTIWPQIALFLPSTMGK